MVHSFFGSKSTYYHQSFSSPLPSGAVAGLVSHCNRIASRHNLRLVRFDLRIRDDRAAEDSAVFQIVNRFINPVRARIAVSTA